MQSEGKLKNGFFFKCGFYGEDLKNLIEIVDF